MTMFKRLRDAATGLFLSKEQFDAKPPASTVEEKAMRRNDLVILRLAIVRAEKQPRIQGYWTLKEAILRVTERRQGS